jgi:hypothetical protein
MHNETCVRVHIKIVLENNLTGPTHVVSGWDKKKCQEKSFAPYGEDVAHFKPIDK